MSAHILNAIEMFLDMIKPYQYDLSELLTCNILLLLIKVISRIVQKILQILGIVKVFCRLDGRAISHCRKRDVSQFSCNVGSILDDWIFVNVFHELFEQKKSDDERENEHQDPCESAIKMLFTSFKG